MEQALDVPRITVNTGRTLTALLPRRGDDSMSLSGRLNSVADRYDILVRTCCPVLSFEQWQRIFNVSGGPVNGDFGDDDPPPGWRAGPRVLEARGYLQTEFSSGLVAQAESLEAVVQQGRVSPPEDGDKLLETAAELRALASIAAEWGDEEALAVAEVNDRFWLRVDEANAAEDLEAFLRSLGARVSKGEGGKATAAPVAAEPRHRFPVCFVSDLAQCFGVRRVRATKNDNGLRFDFAAAAEWATVLLWDDGQAAVFLPEGASRDLVQICEGWGYPPRFGRPGPEHETKGFRDGLPHNDDQEEEDGSAA